MIYNGNRTEWSPIRHVTIRVINNITIMITDRIGRHEVLLPINRNCNKIRERNERKTTLLQRARDGVYRPITLA